jgi:hypothetical protein
MHRYGVVLAISAVLLTGCSTPTVSEATGPKQEQPADAPLEEPKERDAARVGGTLTLSGTEHGVDMAITPLRVVDPAPPADPYLGPGDGNRFVGVELELANVGTSVYRDFPANGARLIDSRSRQYDPAFMEIKVGPTLAQTTIAKGDKRVGFVTFEVPRGTRLAKLQLTLDSGFGPETGEWRLGG